MQHILVKTDLGTLGSYRIEDGGSKGVAVGYLAKIDGTSVIKTVASLIQEGDKLKLFIHDDYIAANDIEIIHQKSVKLQD